MNITIRPMTVDDYEQVHNVDILTQRQYLGVKFDRMIEEEKPIPEDMFIVGELIRRNRPVTGAKP